MADPTQRKLAAILSADVVGYSRLMADDEAETVKTLKAHKDLMGGLIRQHAGRVVDAVGDNLLADFPSVVDAVACAVAIQNELAKRNEDLPSSRRMLFRIGINLGDVIVEEDRIYGDGVNIAARVQALAEEGGVSISGTAFDQVEGKLGLKFEDLGPHEVKNIPRPVRVYRVQVSERHAETASVTVPGFGGRPAIAVLAFDNLSGDPEQEYFADGIAEDLITRLSAWRRFPVIARNSSFVYKGTAVDVKQVSRELGVRYVVEGSVRKAGERVRISAQVIDATTGHHVWAERYDREFQDIFVLQDEITESIVCSIEPTLDRAEQRRALRQPREKLTAWDLVQQGTWHLSRFTKEDTSTARRLFRRAIELDPHFSPAFTQLAMASYYEVVYQWSEAPAQALAESHEAAQQAAALDEEDPHALAVAGASWAFGGKNERGISILERAIELNPSAAFAYWMLGIAYSSLDQQDRGIDLIEKAIRLSPHDSLMHQMLQNLGLAHLMAGRYEDAATCARRVLDLRPDQPHAYRLLAASCGHLGQGKEARSALDAMYRLQPNFSVEILRLLNRPALVDRVLDGLRKAGLKE